MDAQIQLAAPRRPIHYDAVRRRLWICGQRCHHGATGAVLTALGVVAAAAQSRRALALLATGSAMMVHDWHDRPLWFQRGWQSQP